MYRASRPHQTGAGLAERAYVVAALLVFSAAFIPLIQVKAGMVTSADFGGDPLSRAILLPIYLVLAALVLARLGAVVAGARRHPLIVGLTGLAIASFAWSEDPGLTVRRGLAVGITTAFGLYLGARFTRAEQLRLIAWTFGIAAVLSLLLALAVPSYGVTGGEVHLGAWRGIYWHKNHLGRIMALGATTFVLFALDGGRHRSAMWLAAGLSAALVLLSQSASAIVVLLTLAALLPFYFALRVRTSLLLLLTIAALLVGGSVALGLLTYRDTFLAALGKDQTLTGRTVLWAAVLDPIARRPWLGYGLSGFWTGWNGPARDVWLAVGWTPPNSHNGYLDLCLDLGAVGLAAFAIGFVIAAARALTAARRAVVATESWPLVFLTFLLLYNMTESTILRQNSLFWVLYVATVSSRTIRHRSAITKSVDAEDVPAPLPGPARPAAAALSPGVRLRYRARRPLRPSPTRDDGR